MAWRVRLPSMRADEVPFALADRRALPPERWTPFTSVQWGADLLLPSSGENANKSAKSSSGPDEVHQRSAGHKRRREGAFRLGRQTRMIAAVP